MIMCALYDFTPRVKHHDVLLLIKKTKEQKMFKRVEKFQSHRLLSKHSQSAIKNSF